MQWWVTNVLEQPGGVVILVSWAFWVIFSIVLHELAHGWTAVRLGDRTPIETGHMTWNPLVHMGMTSLIVFAVVGIAWGMMPVNPSRLRTRYGEALVLFAGPLMNISLAAMSVVLLALWIVAVGPGQGGGQPAVSETLYQNTGAFLFYGASLNVVLALFNLLPLPPLDGGRIVGVFIPAFTRMFDSEGGRVAFLVLLLATFFFAGGYLFAIGTTAANEASALLVNTLTSTAPTPTP